MYAKFQKMLILTMFYVPIVLIFVWIDELTISKYLNEIHIWEIFLEIFK